MTKSSKSAQTDVQTGYSFPLYVWFEGTEDEVNDLWTKGRIAPTTSLSASARDVQFTTDGSLTIHASRNWNDEFESLVREGATYQISDSFMAVAARRDSERAIARREHFHVTTSLVSPASTNRSQQQALEATLRKLSLIAVPSADERHKRIHAGPPRYSETQLATSKSPWADQIGPLYTAPAVARETNMSAAAVELAADSMALMWIEDSNGDKLFPVQQFTAAGQPLPGLRKLTGPLLHLLDRYMVASWLNLASDELGGRSPWAELKQEGVSERLERAASELATRMSTATK